MLNKVWQFFFKNRKIRALKFIVDFLNCILRLQNMRDRTVNLCVKNSIKKNVNQT